MRREVVIAIVALAAVVLVLVGGAVLLILGQPSKEAERAGPPSPPAGTSAPATAEPAVKAPARPVPMEFTREGVAGKMTTAVERVVRPGNAQVAVSPRNGGRWVCILVNGRERYVELDQGLKPEEFPWIQEGGFQRPPPHISRSGTSIYRSVAKRAMGYDAERGDRILIVVCPRDEWPQLRLEWPATSPP